MPIPKMGKRLYCGTATIYFFSFMLPLCPLRPLRLNKGFNRKVRKE